MTIASAIGRAALAPFAKALPAMAPPSAPAWCSAVWTVTTSGYGEAKPVASNDNAAGRQRKRRIEIVVSGAG